MTLNEQVYVQSMLLAGELTLEQTKILEIFCMSATNSLTARLRDGLRPDDCKADFIAAASLLALAALNGVGEDAAVEQITAGDLTIRKNSSGDPASNVLRNQAQLMIAPYLKDRFSFRGV